MPLVGDVLADRYRIDGPLGAGGMASVWRARDLRLGRDVALKVLLPNLSADRATAARFDREARSLAAAAHPSVVAVFDVEPGDPGTGREPFYVMELCNGGSLADRLAATGRIPPSELTPVLDAVAAGLADLHRRGMVHRDVKPHNILFCDGRAKLADFGLARSEGDGLDALTATGTTIGTLAYLAPEQLSGAPAAPASDVYALAVVAFQALTGRLPRPAASVTQVVETRSAPPATVSESAPELGAGFDDVLARALSANPADRPGPAELAEGVRRAASATAPPPPLADRPTAPFPLVDALPAAEPVAAAGAHDAIRATRGNATGAQRATRASVSRVDRRRSRPALGAIAVAAVVIAGLVGFSLLVGDQQPGRPAGSPAALTATQASLATARAATPVPPTPPVDPAARRAMAALPEVYGQIDQARAEGLEDETADELERRARAVEEALRASDLKRARERADRLLDLAEDVRRIGGDDDDEKGEHPVGRAAERLRKAIPGGG